MKKIYSIITIILVMVTLSVCGCSSTTTVIQQVPTSVYVPTTTSPPTFESFFIEGGGFLTMHVGEQIYLGAMGVYSDGGENYATPVWAGNNPAVASVVSIPLETNTSSNGDISVGIESCRVQGISPGTVIISASMPGIDSTQLVQVTVIP